MPLRPQSPPGATGLRPAVIPTSLANPSALAARTTPTVPVAPALTRMPPATARAPAPGAEGEAGLTHPAATTTPTSTTAPAAAPRTFAPACDGSPTTVEVPRTPAASASAAPTASLPHPAILSGGHAAPLRLARRQVAVLAGRPGLVLACQAGEVWFTEDGSRCDRILAAGQTVALTRRGPLVVSACRAARLTLAAPPAGAPLPFRLVTVLGRTFRAAMDDGARTIRLLAAQSTAPGHRPHLGHGDHGNHGGSR